MTTRTEDLDNLYTTTWQHMGDEVADNIFDSTPLWFWMRDKGRFKTKVGGRFISHPLRFAKSDNVKWVTKGDTVSLDDKEFLTSAQYDWRYVIDSIVRFGIDEQQNQGKQEILSIMTAKLENAQDSLVDTLETALFAAQSGDTMSGLQNLVADDPTAAATVGGIAQDTETWWRNQVIDMTGLSFATHGIPNMRTMRNNVGNNLKMDMPDIIVSGQVPFEYYEDSTQEQKQIVNQKLGDAGFDNIQFKGMPMVWSPACADTRMYFLNTNFLAVTYDPTSFFEMTEWKAIPNQVNDRAAQIVVTLELMTSRRRAQGVLFDIDTA